jgi:hypothetical protein
MKWKRKLSVVALAFISLLLILIVWRISITAVARHRLNAITARGEPADAAALDTFYKTVPDSENAAIVWLEGVAALEPDPAKPPFWGGKITLPRRGIQTDADVLELAKGLISSNQEAMAIFHRAAALSQSRYPVNLTAGPLTDFRHLSKVKSAALALRVQALVATEQGDTHALAQAIVDILGAGQSLKAEPTLISQLVRYAIDTIAFNTLEFALNRTRLGADASLDKLAAAFAKSDDPQSLALALIGERAFFVSYLSDPKRYFAAGGAASSSPAEEAFSDAFAWPVFRASGLLQWEMRFGVDAFTTNIALARLPDPQRFLSVTNSVELEVVAKHRYHILTALLLPALDKAFRRDALHRTQARLAQAALAVEHYRVDHDRPPDHLSDLIPKYLRAIPVDPFDGQPLRYKPTTAGYVLYSVGPDQKDDGGLEKPPGAKDKDPWDVTFIVERK